MRPVQFYKGIYLYRFLHFGGADFTVGDRKKMRKGITERSGSKQQALRGTGVNIDCRWAPTGIAMLCVSLPKQGVVMATISRRITRIISEQKLQGITIKRRNSKNGYTPYEIYGPHEVIKTLSDPGHWEKKCWITMYNKKFLLPTDYGANDESTLKMGFKQPSPMNSPLRDQNVQENSII